jgi:hypothetical protein
MLMAWFTGILVFVFKRRIDMKTSLKSTTSFSRLDDEILNRVKSMFWKESQSRLGCGHYEFKVHFFSNLA